MTRDTFKVRSDSPHFFTFTTVEWTPIFLEDFCRHIVLDSFVFVQSEQNLILYGYVIMDHHAHLIASAPDLSGVIRNMKSFTSRQIIDSFKEKNCRDYLRIFSRGKARHKKHTDFQVWQEGSHPEMILGDKMMRTKLDYIHYNPVKRGFVEKPEHWKYSSARDYVGMNGLIPLNGRHMWY